MLWYWHFMFLTADIASKNTMTKIWEWKNWFLFERAFLRWFFIPTTTIEIKDDNELKKLWSSLVSNKQKKDVPQALREFGGNQWKIWGLWKGSGEHLGCENSDLELQRRRQHIENKRCYWCGNNITKSQCGHKWL